MEHWRYDCKLADTAPGIFEIPGVALSPARTVQDSKRKAEPDSEDAADRHRLLGQGWHYQNELGGLSEVVGIEELLEASVDMESNIAVGSNCIPHWRSLFDRRTEESDESRTQIAIFGDHEMIPGSAILETLAELLQVPTC